MKIGVFSDTHDNLQSVAQSIQVFQKEKVELIIHCGDWVSPFVPQFIFRELKLVIPIKSVFGNNDGDIFRFFERQQKENWDIESFKETFDLKIDGKKIVVYHGSSVLITESLISSKKYDAVFTGHTHKAVNETVNGVLHLNPGSPAGYCESKITDNKTIALYDSIINSAKIINL